MIEKIRQYSETWWFKTFLGLIALIFVLLWGGGDLLNQIAGNRQTVATVGDVRLTSWEFEKALNREVSHLSREIGRDLTPEEVQQSGLYRSTLLKLVDETLVELEAVRLGLTVSDQAVRDAITKNPLFQTQEGGFNKQNLLHILARFGYSEAGFVEEMRRDMTRMRLFKALFQGLIYPSEQAKVLYRWQEQTRQLSYTIVDSADVIVKEKPTPPQLAAFFKEHAASFQAPELRNVKALIIDAERIAQTLTVTQDALMKSFEERAGEFEGKKFAAVKPQLEKDLKHSQALEMAYSLSTQGEDLLAGGATLEEVAQRLSLPLKELKQIDINGHPDLFKTIDGKAPEVTELERAIAAEAFSLDPEGTGSAIEVKNGLFFVAQVTQVFPSKPRTQKDIHPLYAEKLWQQFVRQKKVFKLVKELKESAQDRGKLAIAANKQKLRLQTIKVSRKGVSMASSLALTPTLLNEIFAAQKGQAVVGLLERAQDKPAFLVGLVEAIHYPAVKEGHEEFLKVEKRLSDLQKEDFSRGYVTALRKRFPVNINQRFLESLASRSPPEAR